MIAAHVAAGAARSNAPIVAQRPSHRSRRTTSSTWWSCRGGCRNASTSPISSVVTDGRYTPMRAGSRNPSPSRVWPWPPWRRCIRGRGGNCRSWMPVSRPRAGARSGAWVGSGRHGPGGTIREAPPCHQTLSSFNTTTDKPATRRNAVSLVTSKVHRSWMLVAACSASGVLRFKSARTAAASSHSARVAGTQPHFGGVEKLLEEPLENLVAIA